MASSARETTTISHTTATTTPPPETTSGIVTAWIPLTTIAPPPYPYCWNESFNSDHNTTFDSIPVAFDPDFAFVVGSSYIYCQPAQVITWFDHATASATKGALATVTSIQPIVCPSEWSTALNTTVGKSVQVTCCPSGYTADPHSDHGYEANCGSTMPPSTTFVYYTNSTYVTTAYSVAVSVAAVAIKGWNSIVEAPATTIITTTTSTYLSSSSSSSSFSTTSSSSTSSPSSIGATTEPSGVSHSSGLHGGAAAGIFAGVFAAVALVGVGIFMFLRRRRHQSLATSNTDGGDSNISDLKSGQYVNVPQNPGHRLSELPTVSNTPELYTDYDPHSLRGNGMEIHELQ